MIERTLLIESWPNNGDEMMIDRGEMMINSG
jgi:hypothetical protein